MTYLKKHLARVQCNYCSTVLTNKASFLKFVYKSQLTVFLFCLFLPTRLFTFIFILFCFKFFAQFMYLVFWIHWKWFLFTQPKHSYRCLCSQWVCTYKITLAELKIPYTFGNTVWKSVCYRVMNLSVNSILEGASEEEEVHKEDACYWQMSNGYNMQKQWEWLIKKNNT